MANDGNNTFTNYYSYNISIILSILFNTAILIDSSLSSIIILTKWANSVLSIYYPVTSIIVSKLSAIIFLTT